MRLSRKLVLVVLFALLVGLSTGAAMAGGYSVELLPWSRTGEGHDINEEGDVVGYTYAETPVEWIGGVLSNVLLPPGFSGGYAHSINDKRNIAGRGGPGGPWAFVRIGGQSINIHPSGWSRSHCLIGSLNNQDQAVLEGQDGSGRWQVLIWDVVNSHRPAMPDGWTEARGSVINDHGAVVGVGGPYNDSAAGGANCYIWQDGQTVDVFAPPPGYSWVYCGVFINDEYTVAGTAIGSSGPRAFIKELAKAPRLIPLPSGWSQSHVKSINNGGLVVLNQNTWPWGAAVWNDQTGILYPLPQPAGYGRLIPWTINNHGLVVGYCEGGRPFIARPSDTTPPEVHWDELSPVANDAGWHNTNVTIRFTVTDDTDPAPGSDRSAPLSFENEGAGQTQRVTVWDSSGNTATYTSPVVNIDKTPPTIAGGRTPDANAYGWNNTDVTVSFDASDDLSGVHTVSGPMTLDGEGEGQSVTGTAVDRAGNSATSTVGGINIDRTPPANVVIVSTGGWGPFCSPYTANLTGSFDDLSGAASQAVWTWDDGSTTNSEYPPPGSGTVAGSHSYNCAGVYTIKLNVTDVAGNTSAPALAPAYLVLYDPDGGFVTGGGWIMSPAGACPADPALAGKASFGFNSKYHRGASIPSGQTQFQFKVADLNFHSTAYEWLVIAGAKAQYKGTGTLNEAGDYGFMLTGVDGQLDGGGGVDKFRIRIWDRETDGVIYDNMLGEPNDSAAATELGGGSIVIHRSDTKSIAAATLTSASAAQTAVGAQIVFTLTGEANVSVDIVNVAGRLVNQVSLDRPSAAGVNTLLWDGCGRGGAKVPSGHYLVLVKAYGRSGQAIQTVTPLRISR